MNKYPNWSKYDGGWYENWHKNNREEYKRKSNAIQEEIRKILESQKKSAEEIQNFIDQFFDQITRIGIPVGYINTIIDHHKKNYVKCVNTFIHDIQSDNVFENENNIAFTQSEKIQICIYKNPKEAAATIAAFMSDMFGKYPLKEYSRIRKLCFKIMTEGQQSSQEKIAALPDVTETKQAKTRQEEKEEMRASERKRKKNESRKDAISALKKVYGVESINELKEILGEEFEKSLQEMIEKIS